jgi:hypothetical protein
MASKIEITVVVNGQPTQVSAPPDASVQSLFEPALTQTGNAGQPVGNWELRDQAGNPVEPPKKVGDYAGKTLFLNLKAGIGGCS